MSIETALIVSSLLLWLVVIFGTTLVLGLMKLVGSLSLRVQNFNLSNGADSQPSLRGVNIGEEYVEVNGRSVQIAELSARRPLLLILADPTCEVCDLVVRKLVESPELPTGRAVVIVRGDAQITREVARDLGSSVLVISERPGLGLIGFRPPLAAILNSEGTYVGTVNLREEDLPRAFRLLETEQEHQAAIEQLALT